MKRFEGLITFLIFEMSYYSSHDPKENANDKTEKIIIVPNSTRNTKVENIKRNKKHKHNNCKSKWRLGFARKSKKGLSLVGCSDVS